MPKIQKLSEQIANQIAAGEVVERPVAVVKELVENSIDAGATQIEIHFRKGGKALIEVHDNGSGMEREDALLCLERHATSKIRQASDLDRIRSFGFRGEAVPSIASVSQFKLQTRTQEQEAGTELRVDAGKVEHVGECAMPVGTRISVARLFHPVPARRAFLKTDRTEGAHIIQLCRLLAVAHPDISFALIEDGRTLFRSPACPSLSERVAEIFGRQLASQLIELPESSSLDGRRISGLVSRPGYGRSTRAEMNFFVNQRPVDSRLLFYAVVESFHTYLPRGRYPVTFLFLDLDPGEIDVNVHPAKREIRFRHEGAVRQFIMDELLRTLRNASRRVLADARPVDPVPDNDDAEQEDVASDEADSAEDAGASTGAPSARPDAPIPEPAIRPGTPPVRPAPRPAPSSPEPARPSERRSAGDHPEARPSVDARPIHTSSAGGEGKPGPSVSSGTTEGDLPWRFLGLHAARFAVFDGPDGIVTVHVAAAMERIQYERVLSRLQESEPASQILLFPLSLELDPLSASTVEAHASFFEQIGFEIEAFGRHSYRVRSIPDWFGAEEAASLLEDLIALIRERGLKADQNATTAGIVAAVAARRLVRGQKVRGPADALDLVRELFQCRNPLTDPRGRPVLLETRTSELERKFGIS